MLPLFLVVASLAEPILGDVPPEVERLIARSCAWIDEVSGAALGDVRADFDEGLSQALSERALRTVLAPLRDAGPVRATLVDTDAGQPPLVSTTWLLEQDDSLWSTRVVADGQGKITGWWIQRAPLHLARKELNARTAELCGEFGLSLRLLDASGKELDRVELASGRRLFPLGSVFKLYVLAELARQAADGRVHLSDELKIDERKKSLPSGEMHLLADGTPVHIRRMADEMIRISDNTATDHLIALVGRGEIERHLALYGNSAPERNVPFLTTRELFTLKGLTKAEYRELFDCETLAQFAERWSVATSEERVGWLNLVEAHLDPESPSERRGRIQFAFSANTLTSRGHFELEWLARPSDITNLVAQAGRGALVSREVSELFLEVYSAGSPIYHLPGVREQGFKGGSEPGVFALSARVRSNDGRSVVGCLTRCGFEPLDPRVADASLALFQSWLRNLLEGEPPARTVESADTAPAAREER